MSWSIQAIGKRDALVVALNKQFDSMAKCAEPEESVRQNIRSAILNALSGMAPDTAVKISANGSASTNNGVSVAQNAFLSIEPIYGFVG